MTHYGHRQIITIALMLAVYAAVLILYALPLDAAESYDEIVVCKMQYKFPGQGLRHGRT